MYTPLGITLALLFFLGLPAGLILLMLGLYRRGPRAMCVCGYDRTGLPENNPCPECGGPPVKPTDIPRVRWQINVGITLLVLSIGAAAAFTLILLMQLRG